MSNDSFSTYALRPRHEHTYTASTLDASDVDPALGPTTSTTDDIYGINSRNALVPNGNWHPEENLDQAQSEYRLYKRRFSGLAAIVLLNVVTGMAGSWFGPISEEVAADFQISLNQVNWLGNVSGIVYLVIAPFIPFIYRKFGIRNVCILSGALTLLSSWIRVLGTLPSLSPSGSLALLMLASMMVSAANVLVEILGTKFSQTWFDTKGRTTATMAVAVSNSIGSAIGSVLAPSVGSTRKSILVLAVIGTVGALSAALVGNKPPTPPTYSAFAVDADPPTLMDTVRAFFGREKDTSKRTYMIFRQRIDFVIILAVGGVLSSVVDAFGTLSDQIFAPYGYSPTFAGLTAAVLLGFGLLTAIVTAPLLDRVFMKRMGLTIKLLSLPVGTGWLALIWAVKPGNTAGIFVIMGLIGAGSLTMLPVGLEMAVEVTRNAEGSAALINMLVALEGVIFVQIESAMRAGPNAHPPFNLRTALIFNGVMACVVSLSTIFIEGKQTRLEQDEVM